MKLNTTSLEILVGDSCRVQNNDFNVIIHYNENRRENEEDKNKGRNDNILVYRTRSRRKMSECKT